MIPVEAVEAAATRTAGTNPSETIRQLIQEWVNKHKQRGTE